MSEERKPGDIQEKETPATPPVAEPTDPPAPAQEPPADGQPPESGAEDGKPKGDEDPEKKSEHHIPKHRFDEVLEKNKKLETDLESLTERMTAMGEAMTGKKSEATEDEFEAISKKYGVGVDFMKELAGVVVKKSAQANEAGMSSVKKSQAEATYAREVTALSTDFPDAQEMSAEELTELRTLAHDPKYSRTPLKDVYKVMMFDKRPSGKKRTIEGGRGGAARPGGEKDIGDMTLEEFEKFSNAMGKKSE